MKSTRTLQDKTLILFIVFTVLFTVMIYFLFPAFGIINMPIQSLLFISLVVTFLSLAGLLLYFYIENFNLKLQQEKNNTIEIINRYEILSKATNDAIWDHNLLEGETFYNDNLLKMFGYTKEDLKNNSTWWHDNIHSRDKKRVEEKILQALENDTTVWEDEYRFRCNDGIYKIITDKSFIARNDRGKPIRLIGVMHDVTEQRMNEKKIIQEELNKKNSIGQALIESHEQERKNLKHELHEDINQVLATVKLNITQIINNPGKENDAIQHSLHYLDEAMKKIIDISKHLASSSLEFFGLLSAIHDVIIERKTKYPDISIILFDHLFNEENIETHRRDLIYRSFQDILNYVFTHADVSRIIITLNNEKNKTNLQIAFDSMVADTIKNDKRIIELRNKLALYQGKLTTSSDINHFNIIAIEL